MRSFLLLLGLALPLAAQVNVQKNASGVLSNGPIVVGAGNSITTTGSGQIVATGGTILQLTPQTSTPTWVEGRLFYDQNSHSLAYYNDASNVTVNVGRESITRVRNSTGSTILNGRVVYISGATGQAPRVSLAQANSGTTSRVIGVATEDIANNGVGYVTTSGEVHDLDTSAFADGDTVYLSATTAGALTTIRQGVPNYNVLVGTILYAHPVNGILLVHPEYDSVMSTDIQNSGATGRDLLTSATPTAAKTVLSLQNVENTALSTWGGTSNLFLARPAITRLVGGTATDLDALSLTGLDNGAIVRLVFAGPVVADYRLRARIGGEVAVAQWKVVSTVDANRLWELVAPPSKQGVPAVWNASTSKFHQILVSGTGDVIVGGLAPESAAFTLP